MNGVEKEINTVCADYERAYENALAVRAMFTATKCYVSQKHISNRKKKQCLKEFDKLLGRMLEDMENSYTVSVRLKVV